MSTPVLPGAPRIPVAIASRRDPSSTQRWIRLPLLLKDTALIVGLVLINLFGTPGNLICYAILIWMASRSAEGALRALLVSGVIIAAAGGAFVVFGPYGNLLKFSLIGVAAGRVFISAMQPHARMLKRPHLQWLLVFASVAAILGLVNDYYVEIMALKLVSFTVGTFALLVAGDLRRLNPARLAHWLLAVTLSVAILSVSTYLMGGGVGTVSSIQPGRSFTGLFMGMFSHPQSAGVIFAMLAAAMVSLLVWQQDPLGRHIMLSLLVLFVAGIYLSQTRVAGLGFAFVIIITLMLILSKGSSKRLGQIKRRAGQLATLVLFAIGALVILELVGAVSVGSALGDYLLKDDGAAVASSLDILGLYQDSRGGLIDYNWNQFLQSPWTGVGFGTDTSLQWQMRATMLSASTERGNWLFGLLAEVGVLGALPFMAFIIALYRYLLRKGMHGAIVLLSLLLVMNLSEMFMFSYGSMGLIGWTLVAYGMALSAGSTKGYRDVLGRNDLGRFSATGFR